MLRRELIRRRRHLTVVAAVLLLGAAVVLHHGGMAMGDAHDHQGMSAGIELCVALVTAVGMAIVVGLLVLPPWRPASLTPAGLVLQARPPVPRARPGPPLLCLLCVSRR